MPICIYCLEAKPESAFNKEHVLPRSFGRFRDALTLARPLIYRVCSVCNGKLGSALDIGLARNSWEAVLRITRTTDLGDPRDLRYDRVVIQLPAEHPMAPVLLRFIRRDGSRDAFCTPVPQLRIALPSGARTCIPEWKIEKELPILLRDGQPSEVAMFASCSDLDAFARIEAKSRAAGLTSITWHTVEESSQSDIEQIDANLEFTIDVVIARAIAKIAYEYFIWYVAGSFDHLVKPDLLAPIREFVQHGTQDWRGLVKPSNAAILADETATLRHRDCHLLAMRWEHDGVFVRVALFNDIVYKVKICSPPSPIVHPLEVGHHFDLTTMQVRRLAGSSLLHPPLPRAAVLQTRKAVGR